MRVLLLKADTIEALALQRELAGRHDVRVAATLAEAVSALTYPAWRPDLVVTELNLPDSDGVGTLDSLRAAAGGIPVVVGGGTTDALRRQVDGLGGATAPHRDKDGGPLGLLQAVMQQQQHLFQHTVAAHRREVVAEIERAARQAADAAAARAIDQLVDRLGLEDEEGVRMAIRLARGWDAAKLRFFSAVATGIGSAFLLALGAGVVAMLRENATK